MRNIVSILCLSGLLSCTACQNFFDVEPNNILKEDQNYHEYYEVYSSFIGNAVRFQEAAEHYIVLSELMGGLTTPTSNAPVELWDIFRFQAGNGNKSVAPDPYYKLIINCNDFIRHALQYEKENPGAIPVNVLEGMISEAIRYRAWSYLTLGKLYGKALYHDYSLSDYTDLGRGQMLAFNDLIDQVIYSMENGFNGIDGKKSLVWRDITNIQGDEWIRFGVNPNALLGELYLWKGDYYTAFEFLQNVIKNGNGDFIVKKSGNYSDIFTNSIASNLQELVTVVPFDAIKQQQNKLQYYFSTISPNVYYLKPASRLNELFDIQEWKIDAAEGTGDKTRKQINIGVENGDTVVIKYHRGKAPHERDHYIPIYRAAEIHLMIAEALNHCDLQEEAMAFLNDGVIQYVTPGGFLKRPFNSPLYSPLLVENAGVRGRVNLKRHVLPEKVKLDGTEQLVSSLPEEQQMLIKRQQIDSLILNEYTLELAFEGKRWGVLIRMGRYWGSDFVTGLIKEKFPVNEREKYTEFLESKENWFIPYDPLKN